MATHSDQDVDKALAVFGMLKHQGMLGESA